MSVRKITKEIVGQKERGQPVGGGPSSRSSGKAIKTVLDEKGSAKSRSRVYKATESKTVSAKRMEKLATGAAPNCRTWKQFEQLIVRIQKALAPEAEVRHNRRVLGLSGRRRQFDVVVSGDVGQFRVSIIIECRQHGTRPVTIDKVESFVLKLRDVSVSLGGSLGVMISTSGFDAGARAVAAQNGVILKTFRQAQETDWREFLSEDSWLALTTVEAANVKAYARVAASSEFRRSSLNAIATFGEREGTAGELFVSWYQRNKAITGLGASNLSMPFSEGGELLFQFDVVGKKYLINKLFWGEVQESVVEMEKARPELITFVIDTTDILQNQPSIDLTPEDYERERDVLTQYDITNTKRFVRVSVVKMKD